LKATEIENTFNKNIIVNNYEYKISKKNTNNAIRLLPRSKDFLLHNSFLPEIIIKILNDKLVVEYKVQQSVKILFILITFFMTFIEIGVVTTTSNVAMENKIHLFLIPLIYFVLFSFTFFSFFISVKVVEKKIILIIERKSLGQSGDGSMIELENP